MAAVYHGRGGQATLRAGLRLVNRDHCSFINHPPPSAAELRFDAERRGLPGQQPRKVSKLSVPTFVLGGAMLVLAFGAAAQEAATTARPRPDAAWSRPPPWARTRQEEPLTLGLRGSTTAEQPGQTNQVSQPRPAGLAPRRAPLRFRQITVQPVQAGFRAGTLARDTVRHVQPIFGMEPAALPPLRRRTLDPDPYAPVGYRVGAVNLFPAVEQAIGYDTNPNRSSEDKKGSLLLRTEGELRVQSDWSRHELTGLLRGAYSEYPNIKGADRPDGSGRLNLRLDASRDTQIDFETRYFLDTQRPGSPELEAEVTERPLVSTVGASAGVTQRYGRASLGLRGSIDRTTYEDARLTSGTILDQSDRDRTQYETRLRAGYEVKPGFVPFVEGIADTRIYEREFDRSGFQRTSEGLGARAGSTFEITRLVTGEASAGYIVRTFDDPRLRDLKGPLLDGALVWAATPLTTVRLRAGTQVAETSIEESSGSLVSRATVEVQHDLRRNLSLIGSATLTETDYRGIDLREEGFAGSVRLDYRITRWLGLRASFTHERLKSSDPGDDYTANVYLVGLRFQP
jgi:hypothetical protein